MDYIIISIQEENNIVILENVRTGEQVTVNKDDLWEYSKGNLIIGYNKLSRTVKITTLDDYLKYSFSKVKLMNTPCSIYKNLDGNWVTKATLKIEGDTAYITVNKADDICTKGVFLIDTRSILEWSRQTACKKHLVYDIPTDNYKEVVTKTSIHKIYGIADVTFTDRCTFRGITSIDGLFSGLINVEEVIDMSKLNFDSVNKYDCVFTRDIDYIEDCRGYVLFHSNYTRYRFPEINFSGEIQFKNGFNHTTIDYDKVKFLYNMCNNSKATLDSVLDNIVLKLSGEYLSENIKLIKSITKLVGYINKVVISLTDEVLSCKELSDLLLWGYSPVSKYARYLIITIEDYISKIAHLNIDLSEEHFYIKDDDYYKKIYIKEPVRRCTEIPDSLSNLFIAVMKYKNSTHISFNEKIITANADSAEQALKLLTFLARTGLYNPNKKGMCVRMSYEDYEICSKKFNFRV